MTMGFLLDTNVLSKVMLTLVTRNTKDFQGIADIQVANPWQPH